MITSSSSLDHRGPIKTNVILFSVMNLDSFGQPSVLEKEAIGAAQSQDFDTFERYTPIVYDYYNFVIGV